ncbi:copper resistance protein CopC [Gordonia hydrophobica]|uniref:Copper resistance protein CopC n=1 Tax=Gordonia hydrophobica TaxID=40516 RepID=A0ABZ2U544_9ACTN
MGAPTVGVLAVLALLLIVPASPASAHSWLVSSVPADGATVQSGPSTVVLTFSEPVADDYFEVDVVGPDGRSYLAGRDRAEGASVTVHVAPTGPAGKYRVEYRQMSEDGHRVTGSATFTVTSPGTGEGSVRDDSETQSSSMSGYLVAGGVVLVVVVAAAAIWLLRRNRIRSDRPS